MVKTLPSLAAFRAESGISESDEVLWPILLDVTRVADKKITEHIAAFKANSNVVLTAHQKQSVRQYLLGLSSWPLETVAPLTRDFLDSDDYIKALELVFVGIERNRTMLLGTIRSRISKPKGTEVSSDEYLKIIGAKEKGLAQFVVIDAGTDIQKDSKSISRVITDAYPKLANYHYLAVIFRGQSWNTVSEVALHAESFLAENNFKLFERTKDKKADELIHFLQSNPNIQYSNELTSAVSAFYESIGYGLNFQDLILSETDDTRILVFQKVELDDSVIPCPDCLQTMVRGNSYPKLLLKSYECHNPDCPSRSKIGRGKRFDLFNVKRNLKLKNASTSDLVETTLRKKYRRDIIEDSNQLVESLGNLFTWKGDVVLAYQLSNNTEPITLKGRKVTNVLNPKLDFEIKSPGLELLISRVMQHVQIAESKPSQSVSETNFSLYQGDSTQILSSIPETIAQAVTSPPYYNAREYSQWPTLVCYLIDMAISAKAVFEKITADGVYFYNIGDIVGQDNVYVSSHMSNRRLMLGFYSIMIFEIAGFTLLGNIIWDKGEVQSKRNSTDNPYPTYIKPINCYEHIFIFGTPSSEVAKNISILKLDPVRKINSKGENLLGHTAPFPEELVNYVLSLVDISRGYTLDPFVGSGTTVIASSKLGGKSVGVERDSTYFKLALDRIRSNQ